MLSSFSNYLDGVNSICQEEKLICESQITIEEIIDAINHLNIIGHLGMMESPLTFINFSLRLQMQFKVSCLVQVPSHDLVPLKRI